MKSGTKTKQRLDVDGAGPEHTDRGWGERRFPQAAGVHLAHDVAGTGEPAVVLIHGWGFGNPSALLPQFEHLAARRRVLKPDLPGHGRSDWPPAGFGWKDCVAALVTQMEAAGVERAILCGHSFGGRLAVEVAATYPSHVLGIALLDPVILFPEPVRQQALTDLVPALATENWLAALKGYFSQLFGSYDSPELKSHVLRELAQIAPDIAARIMQEGMATDGSDSLARVRCPILAVIAGVPMDIDRFRDLQPEALVGTVVGSGHWLTLAVPDQVNAMLDRFIEIATTHGRPDSGHAAATTT